jgi:hypothetical protein
MKKAILKSLLFSLLLTYYSVNASNDNPPNNTVNTNFQGKVIDKQTGESLVGVVIEVNGTTIKVYSDLEGNYTINGLKAGKYTVVVNYISYRKDIREIEVKENENKNINILLEPVKN